MNNCKIHRLWLGSSLRGTTYKNSQKGKFQPAFPFPSPLLLSFIRWLSFLFPFFSGLWFLGFLFFCVQFIIHYFSTFFFYYLFFPATQSFPQDPLALLSDGEPGVLRVRLSTNFLHRTVWDHDDTHWCTPILTQDLHVIFRSKLAATTKNTTLLWALPSPPPLRSGGHTTPGRKGTAPQGGSQMVPIKPWPQ